MINEKLLDKIARIISPFLKTKHKDKESHEIAKKILEELEKEA